MENQPSFSHGLLYSVAPENFSNLHLRDEDDPADFDWERDESRLGLASIFTSLTNFLRQMARRS